MTSIFTNNKMTKQTRKEQEEIKEILFKTPDFDGFFISVMLLCLVGGLMLLWLLFK